MQMTGYYMKHNTGLKWVDKFDREQHFFFENMYLLEKINFGEKFDENLVSLTQFSQYLMLN